MIPYILRSTVIMTVCFLFYKLFLQRATFYKLNRWTLLSCLVLSFALPLLSVPRGLTWTAVTASLQQTVYKPSVHPHSFISVNTNPGVVSSQYPSDRANSTRAQRPASAPTQQSEKSGAHYNVPVVQYRAGASKRDIKKNAIILQNATTSHNAGMPMLNRVLQFLAYVYLAGFLLFGLKFLLEIVALCYRAYGRPAVWDGPYRIVETSGNRGPCSFGNTIFLNPALYDEDTRGQILIHEKIHVSGAHTLDILLAELAVVFQWFNPFSWLYRREVENNLEFLTDRSVLRRPEIERSAYQLSLLIVSVPYYSFSLANNYNQSLLKRRIVMMNTKHSAQHTVWKYVALVPLLTGLVCMINRPSAVAQTTAPKKPVSSAAHAAPSSAAMGDTSIHPLSAGPAGVTPSAAPVTSADAPGATTAKPLIIDLGGDETVVSPPAPMPGQPAMVIDEMTAPRPTAAGVGGHPAVTDVLPATGDLAPPAGANVAGAFGSGIDLRQGSWFLTADSDNLDFILKAKDEEDSWQSSLRVKKSEINPFPGMGTVEFKLVRDAGTMTFKGQFDGEQGYGHFQLNPDPAYFAALQKMGVSDMDSSRQHVFFMLNITRGFVGMLQRNGYTPIEQREIVMLAAYKIDESFLKYWKSSGVEDADEARNLIMLKSFHIDADYVNGLKKAGYAHLSVRELVSLKARHIDGKYASGMNAGRNIQISPEELVSFQSMHIDSAYLASLRKVGYDHLDQSEIRSLSAAHVTAEFIRKFQDAGYKDIPVRTLVWAKYSNLSPDEAKRFRDLGYSDVDLTRLGLLDKMGITPEFVTAFHKIGYDNIPLSQLYMLKSSGVDAEYVAKMKEKGFNSTDLNKYVRLKRDFN